MISSPTENGPWVRTAGMKMLTANTTVNSLHVLQLTVLTSPLTAKEPSKKRSKRTSTKGTSDNRRILPYRRPKRLAWLEIAEVHLGANNAICTLLSAVAGSLFVSNLSEKATALAGLFAQDSFSFEPPNSSVLSVISNCKRTLEISDFSNIQAAFGWIRIALLVSKYVFCHAVYHTSNIVIGQGMGPFSSMIRTMWPTSSLV